jgi:hypothetical protein
MQIIVSINRPPPNDLAAQTRWQRTVDTCEVLLKQKGFAGSKTLGPGVWLLSLESELPVLGIVLFHAAEDKHSYRLIVVDERFSWQCAPLAFSTPEAFGGGYSRT